MAEFFELTAYCKNSFFKNQRVDLSDFIKTPYTVSFDTVNHGGFTAYTVSIESLVMKEDTFETLAGIAKAMLDALDNAAVASGTYELTGYLTAKINTLKELDKVLYKFPLLFFRQGEEKGYTPYKTVNGIAIIYNEKSQDLFSAL